MINFLKTILFGIILISQIILAQKNNISEIPKSAEELQFVEKKAGIAFRIDDNYAMEYYTQMASIFNNYNSNFGRDYHFSFALNFAASYNYNNTVIPFNSPSYISAIKAIQDAGHEIMDHTPNHRTNYFITEFPANDYLQNGTAVPIPGVDQIIEQANGKRKICLEFNSVDILGQTPIGTCNVHNDTIYGNFSSINYDTEIYVYLEGYGLYFIYNFFNNKTKAQILDIWENPVSLPQTNNINFYKFDRKKKLSINAIRVLANETLKLADLYEIDRPTTWIQPGGRHPVISTLELSTALKPLGYKAGASFGDTPKSLKVFNEHDPNEYLEFGMQWEDFNEDWTSQTISTIKTTIADGIAKNKVMIGHNHFYDLKGNNGYVLPTEYFQRVEEILAWCHQNNIEINTYKEWAEILYEKTPDPFENVFPPINVNLDTYTNTLNPNGIPDGYYLRTHSAHGEWTVDNTAPENIGYSYGISSWDSTRIFLVQELGGLEKGEVEFEIWTKGINDSRNQIKVIFSFPSTSYPFISFEIPSSTTNWTKYNLSQSLNQNKSLIIPYDVTKINVEVKIKRNGIYSQINVTGMSIKKKKQSIAANLKINLEGPYTNGIMDVSQNYEDSISQTQPYFISPWEYNGTETITISHQNIVDWVLVELRSDSTSNYYVHSRKAGLLKNDGTIINSDGTPFSVDVASGDYYIVIYHRNHLPVMSSVPVTFN
ncbi:MAG: hypothetical protein IPM32_17125 [Ignavibacteriae bacterium]|nr:hypothetical protein [Ignavibacteriota bacterium]